MLAQRVVRINTISVNNCRNDRLVGGGPQTLSYLWHYINYLSALILILASLPIHYIKSTFSHTTSLNPPFFWSLLLSGDIQYPRERGSAIIRSLIRTSVGHVVLYITGSKTAGTWGSSDWALQVEGGVASGFYPSDSSDSSLESSLVAKWSDFDTQVGLLSSGRESNPTWSTSVGRKRCHIVPVIVLQCKTWNQFLRQKELRTNCTSKIYIPKDIFSKSTYYYVGFIRIWFHPKNTEFLSNCFWKTW